MRAKRTPTVLREIDVLKWAYSCERLTPRRCVPLQAMARSRAWQVLRGLCDAGELLMVVRGRAIKPGLCESSVYEITELGRSRLVDECVALLSCDEQVGLFERRSA